MTEFRTWVCVGPKCFQVLGLSPSLLQPDSHERVHVVNRGTLGAPCRLKAQRKRVTHVGSPCSPVFPNIMSCLKSPITAKPRITH